MTRTTTRRAPPARAPQARAATPTRANELEVAVAGALRLLSTRPAAAKAQAEAILKRVPDNAQGLLVLGGAQRRLGDARSAQATLSRLVRLQPDWAPGHTELGLALGDLGQGAGALASLRRAVTLNPDNAEAWRALGDPELAEAAAALTAKRHQDAERILIARQDKPTRDVAAVRLLAEIARRLSRYNDATALLARAVELAPTVEFLRHNLAVAYFREQRGEETLVEVDRLLAVNPDKPDYRNLRAAALVLVGGYDEAILIYEGLLETGADQPKVWLSYGHALRTANRQKDCIAAYRRSIDLAPTLGEAYWSLANLKTFRFSDADMAAISAALARSDLEPDDRLHLEYSLGKAMEDTGAFEASFRHYTAGAEVRLTLTPYDAEGTTRYVNRCKAYFTAARFKAHQGHGHPAPDPIFVLGLPRSGSTLVEQILSSHSAVEGTMELPNITAIARNLGRGELTSEATAYFQTLETLDADALAELGQRFLDATAVQRKTAKPFFIDKMPNNFLNIGLIQLILPNAKIIDTRRSPMATCFSGFKQHFATGQNFSYSLTDIGRFYRDYVDLMAHFDRVLPGRIHRVRYEQMVDDTEGEVRRLLDYCGLPFEPGCLRFYENDRAVRTASSEQVRRPIFREGVDQWRNYEPWLGPLKTALGPALEAY